jgi:hypothetical protein
MVVVVVSVIKWNHIIMSIVQDSLKAHIPCLSEEHENKQEIGN